jgi:ribosomal protein L12E/L44/L45/RPP1/RPP2
LFKKSSTVSKIEVDEGNNALFISLQGEKIQTILKAAAVDVEPYWPGLFAKALEGISVKDLITRIGSGVGAAPAGGGKRLFILMRDLS